MKISNLARQILEDWRSPRQAALPYIHAMLEIDTLVTETPCRVDGEETVLKTRVAYGAESAADVVSYFLSNASSWHGEVAQRVKKELRALLKEAWEVS